MESIIKTVNGEDLTIAERVKLSVYYHVIYEFFNEDFEFSLIRQNIVSLDILKHIISCNTYKRDIPSSFFNMIRTTPHLHGYWTKIEVKNRSISQKN